MADPLPARIAPEVASVVPMVAQPSLGKAIPPKRTVPFKKAASVKKAASIKKAASVKKAVGVNQTAPVISTSQMVTSSGVPINITISGNNNLFRFVQGGPAPGGEFFVPYYVFTCLIFPNWFVFLSRFRTGRKMKRDRRMHNYSCRKSGAGDPSFN